MRKYVAARECADVECILPLSGDSLEKGHGIGAKQSGQPCLDLLREREQGDRREDRASLHGPWCVAAESRQRRKKKEEMKKGHSLGHDAQRAPYDPLVD